MKAIIASLIVIISAYAMFSMFSVEKVIENREANINKAIIAAMK